jgi:putative transposase
METGLVERLDRYPWSSHKGYLSDDREWNWLHRHFVLSRFSKTASDSRKIFEIFVLEEPTEEINQVLVSQEQTWPLSQVR